MNKSYNNQHNTSHDNTFNFGNELDISNGKKDKTGEMFFKQAYDFDDFQNIGDDKTVKSSHTKAKRQNQSNIVKRDDQFSSKVIGNSILNDFQLSGTNFHTKKVLDQSINKAFSQFQKEPQFGDRKFSAEDTERKQRSQFSKDQYLRQPSNMKNSQLSYSKSNVDSHYQIIKNSVKAGLTIQGIQGLQRQVVSPQFQDYAQSFRKKEPTNFKQQNLLSREEEYKEMMSMINFYKTETQKMSYQRMVLDQESIPEIMNLANSQAFEEQIKISMEDINRLNVDIEKERAIEKKLTRVIAELEEQYNQIIESVNEMDFQRPAIIKDEAKVLMDQINQLKKAFNELQIDNGSLNLSCTIPVVGTLNSIENKMGQSQSIQLRQTALPPQELQTQNYINSLLQQIHAQNSISEDPQFLKNLKLACIKDQWTIFSNKQIIVSVDYKTCPLIKLRIGNKTNQQLRKFTMEIQIKTISVKYMENQILNKKAFLLEGIKVDIENLPEVFIKVNLTYQVEDTSELKKIKLFCPTGLINFGQFTPLTFKEFETEMALPLPIIESPLRPMDKNFINKIDEIMFYLPNIKKYENQIDKVFGLFMSALHQGTLVLIEENCDLLKIKLKNGNRSLLKLLQFILTV